MKRILVALVMAALLLCGCSENKPAKTQPQDRFIIEYQQASGSWTSFTIIRDTETGKAYLFTQSGYAGGLATLEEDEG